MYVVADKWDNEKCFDAFTTFIPSRKEARKIKRTTKKANRTIPNYEVKIFKLTEVR